MNGTNSKRAQSNDQKCINLRKASKTKWQHKHKHMQYRGIKLLIAFCTTKGKTLILHDVLYYCCCCSFYFISFTQPFSSCHPCALEPVPGSSGHMAGMHPGCRSSPSQGSATYTDIKAILVAPVHLT